MFTYTTFPQLLRLTPLHPCCCFSLLVTYPLLLTQYSPHVSVPHPRMVTHHVCLLTMLMYPHHVYVPHPPLLLTMLMYPTHLYIHHICCCTSTHHASVPHPPLHLYVPCCSPHLFLYLTHAHLYYSLLLPTFLYITLGTSPPSIPSPTSPASELLHPPLHIHMSEVPIPHLNLSFVCHPHHPPLTLPSLNMDLHSHTHINHITYLWWAH